MRILLGTIILIFIFSSCKLTENNIVGKYHNYHNFENSTVLEVSADHNFKYSMQAGLVFFKASGQWKIVRDTLILSNADSTSSIESKHITFLIKRKKLIEIQEKGLKGITLK